MARPVIAIVGRPNVGKSTLFNKLVGERISIVDDTPGVTRDRIYGKVEWLDRVADIIDTGGIEPYSDDIILKQMRRQAELAIDAADVIILVTDLRSGVVASDVEVATMLQKSGRPIVLCVNKCDKIGEPEPEFYEFYNLGLGDPIQVSSVHGHGTGDLLEAVFEHIPDSAWDDDNGEVIFETVIEQETYDNSEYNIAGDIIDHRNGKVTVKMGKPTAEEQLVEMASIAANAEYQLMLSMEDVEE